MFEAVDRQGRTEELCSSPACACLGGSAGGSAEGFAALLRLWVHITGEAIGMTRSVDRNAHIIEEFRANAGRVGGPFEGAPMVLVHHRGRRTGRELVNPMMYLRDDADPATIYVFASKGGAPTDPDWYRNLVAAGAGEVEVGTERYPVTVAELTGEHRDRVYAEQARRHPGFADYERRTAGVRTIPVLALRRR
jgi:deazaflavin-dependent oxidoreductase (nitroreductase family)